MITCWPRTSERRRPTMRPSTSVPPPGANGTTMVNGRVGQLCAAAGPAPSQQNPQTTNAASTAYLGRMYRRIVIAVAR